MKAKNIKKIVVSTMAIAMGAALAGSISGTVAWYQYSTKASASYVGTSKHSTHKLEMSLTGADGSWATSFTSAQLKAAALNNHDGSNWSPVTNGVANDGAAALGNSWYGNPRCGYFAYDKWLAADAGAFLQFQLYFRVLDVNGASTAAYLAKDLYFTDFVVGAHTDSTTPNAMTGTDFDESVRVHVASQAGSAAATYALLSKTANTTGLNLNGQLDLNNDGHLDTNKDAPGQYNEWGDAEAVQNYGGDTAIVQKTKSWDDYKATDTGTAFTAGTTKLGTTTTDGTAAGALKLTFTIWMEGWAELANGASGNADSTANFQVWDVAKYINQFHIGMTFGVEPHTFH